MLFMMYMEGKAVIQKEGDNEKAGRRKILWSYYTLKYLE